MQPTRSASPEHFTVRRHVWLVGVSHAINHYVTLIFPAVLLLVQQEFGLRFATLGLLANAALLCYGLGALPAGLLADRFGGHRVLAVWLLGGSAACLGIGLTGTAGSLAVGLTLLGIFASLHHPAGSGLLVLLRGIPGADVGRAFGLGGLLGNVGMAASPLLSAWVAAHWGWRASFFLGAVPGLLLAVPMWRSGGIVQSPPSGATPLPRPAPPRWADLTLPLLLLFGLETLAGFVFQGFTTFMPALLATWGGIPGLTAAHVTRGGILASLALICGGIGHLAAGRLMGLPAREAILLATTSASAAALFGMGVTTGLPLVLLSVLLTLTHFSLGTMSNTLIAFHTPPHLGGTAFGVTFGLAFGLGSLAASTMGFVGDYAGLPAIFSTLGGIATGAALTVVAFGRSVDAWRPLRQRLFGP
jgi:MFS family permease